MRHKGITEKQMKKKNTYDITKNLAGKCRILLFYTALVLAGAGFKANAQELPPDDVPNTESVALQTQKKTDGKIVEKKGEKYYEYTNGKKAKKKFVTIGKKTYYFNKKGCMEKGWLKKGKDYYYFDRNTGVQKKNTTVDGIKIGKNGKAKKTKYNTDKIDLMIMAKKIMKEETSPTDSKEQKLKKVFDWVLKHPYKRHHIFDRERKTKGWEILYAKDIFGKEGSGCCVSEACAFAFLAVECGYREVYVCDDTGHAWVEIGGSVYDTLFAEAKNYNNYYNSTYKIARLHLVNKLKI